MMVQLPLKFPTDFYIAHATSNMNKYYAPLPRPSTDHKNISCKTPRTFNSPVLSSSPVRNNDNSSSRNGKKPWFRPHCLFPRMLIHKVRTAESGPSSSSSSSSSKYRLTACFYKKNIPPCRGSGSAPYMKPADLAVTISEAKSDGSFESTDSCLGELQPILTNVSTDHESRWDYDLEDPSEEMLDDIDRKIAGICMEEERNIGGNNMNISISISSNGGKVENRDTANRIRNIGGVDNSHIDRSSSMNNVELQKGVGDDHVDIDLSNEEAGIHIENNNNNKEIKHVDSNGEVQGMDTEEEANIAGDGKFKYDEIKLVDVTNMDQETIHGCSNGEFAQDVSQLSVIVSGVNISNWEVSNEAGVVINRETSEVAFIDMFIKGEMENADNDMEKSSDGEFELDIFKPSIMDMDMDSSMNIKKGEIVLGGRVSDEQLEEQPLEINREIEHAMEEENSRISNEEYFELDLSSPSKRHGNIVPENNMMVQKSNILMDQMKEYRSLDSIKKHDAEVSSSDNLGSHSRRLFVAKKLKDSAKRRLLVLFNRPYKHKTKKKVIMLTTDEGSETYFWSKPILRGKRCRELPVEEFLYTAGACGGGAVTEVTMEAVGDRFTFS